MSEDGVPVGGTDAELERLATEARAGRREALEALCTDVYPRVFGLARRFLWHPADAEDATQEILVRVVTGLATFEGRSRFTTWLYRIAANALVSFRRSALEERRMTFEGFAADLAEGLADAPAPDSGPEHALLLEEVKVGCTSAMLLCLDREHRLAYILGEILELDHREASEVLAIGAAAFRKRLERARKRVTALVLGHCGLAAPERPCRCAKRLPVALAQGRVEPDRLLFARDARAARAFPGVLEAIRRLEGSRRAAALLRSHPPAEGSGAALARLVASLDASLAGRRGSRGRRGLRIV